MEKLIKFLIQGITASEDFTVSETIDGDRIDYLIKAPKELMGLLIGKGGKTIRAIRTLVKVRATIEKKAVNVSLEEASA